MGAEQFSEYAAGATVEAAWRTATDEARVLHGIGGYSGTLAEKDSYVVVQATPLPLVEARRLAERLVDACDERVDDKHGPAGAIAVAADAVVSERTVRVTVKVPLERYAPRLEDLVAGQVKLAVGEHVTAVREVEDRPKFAVGTEPSSEPRETRYAVLDGRPLPAWDRLFSSQADARAEALRRARETGRDDRPEDFEVVGITRRASGAPLVKVRRVRKSWEKVLDVTIGRAAAT